MYKGDDFIFGRFAAFKEGTQIKRKIITNKKIKAVLGLFPRVLVTSDDGDDVIVLGMPQQRGHMLSIFSPLYLSQCNRGELGGFDSTFASLPCLQTPTSPTHPPPLASVTF